MNTKTTYKAIFSILIICLYIGTAANAQVCEWRLGGGTFNPADPDGAGPATGSVTFTLQVHTTSGSIPLVTAISTGYSYQSTRAMVPTNVNCALASSPSNIVLSPELIAGGYTFFDVNQCGTFVQNAGGQPMDRRAVGTLQASGSITITTAWMNLYTVTLWTLGGSFPEGGYVAINSTENGTPNPFSSYAISTQAGDQYEANSITYATPLAIGSVVPVLFSQFDAKCSSNGTLVSWTTAQESNSSHFEVQRSVDGNTWRTIGSTPAAGNSSVDRRYSQIDLEAGNAVYRIRQVDKDGQFVYTQQYERANCQVKNISAVIYPVPARDVLNVVIKSDKAVRTQLMVFDVSGKLVKKLDANVQNGTNNFRIELKGLTSGDYIIRSSDAGVELNKKFTIMN